MNWLFGKLPEIFSGILLILPLLAALHYWRFHDWKKTGLYFLFASWLIAAACYVGFPNIRFLGFAPNVNLIPGVGMRMGEGLANVVLVFPMGFLVPILWKKFRTCLRTAGMGLLISAAIEVSQIFSSRATDVNDLLTNTLGAFLGYLVAKLLTLNFRRCPEYPESDLFLLCTLTAVIMFFPWPYVYPLFC